MAVSFTWLAHSAIFLELDGHRVLIDPFLTNNPLSPAKPDEFEVEHILLTHAHGDHVGMTESSPAGDTISIAQRTGAQVVCNYEMGNWFMAKGVQNVFQGNPGGTMRGEYMDVKWTQAFHSSSFEDGSYGGQPNGLIIKSAGATLYHAGDTSLFGDMALIGEEGIDVAFLPIGDVYTMGVDDSIRAVKLLKPKYVMPIHYNTWPPLVQDVVAWADRVNRDTEAQPIVLDPGGTYSLD